MADNTTDRGTRHLALDRVLAGASFLLVVAIVAGVVVWAENTSELESPSAAVAVTGSACGRSVHGSGVVVGSPDGPVVITAAHVLRGATHVEVIDTHGSAQVGQPIAFDEARDIAVLRGSNLNASVAEIETVDSGGGVLGVVGENGEPEPLPFEIRRRVTAHVTDESGDLDVSRRALEIVARVDDGDSGAGLFRGRDRVVGVLWASSRVEDERAWAVDASEILAVLAEISDGSSPPVDLGSCI